MPTPSLDSMERWLQCGRLRPPPGRGAAPLSAAELAIELNLAIEVLHGLIRRIEARLGIDGDPDAELLHGLADGISRRICDALERGPASTRGGS